MLKSTATAYSELTTNYENKASYIAVDWLLRRWLKRDQNADWKKKYS